MPTLISRAEALARIVHDAQHPACLMCAIIEREAGPVHVIFEDAEQLITLPLYVRRWGHVMVVPKLHVVDYDEVDPELWARTSRLAHQAARMVERVMRPRRCYMASTGSSSGEELIQTSRHLHIHVIPIYEPDDRPGSVFSWSDGVYVGEPEEWTELLARYRAEWSACSC
jgi:diadenosine tetraphosphate (Ap4A) HIT family hydrolase